MDTAQFIVLFYEVKYEDINNLSMNNISSYDTTFLNIFHIYLDYIRIEKYELDDLFCPPRLSYSCSFILFDIFSAFFINLTFSDISGYISTSPSVFFTLLENI